MKYLTELLRYFFFAGIFSVLILPLRLNAQTTYQSDDHSAYGQIQEIGGDSLVVNNTTFFVDSDTEIRDQFHSELSFGDLKTGNFVAIMYKVQSDDTYLADKIVVSGMDEFEISGIVQSIGSDSLVVHDFVIHTDSTTKIYGEDDSMMTMSQINVGDFVEIEAVVESDSTLFAVRIKVETEFEHESDFIELEGTITSKTSASIGIDGTILAVDTGTVVMSWDHKMLTFDDLIVGMHAEAKAMIQPDSSYLAKWIKVEPSEKNQIEVTASIDSISGSNLFIKGMTFMTDTTTEIFGSHHNTLTLGDLAVGMIVRVHGVKVSDSTYHATRIRVRDFWRPFIEVFGTIDSVGSDYILVHNHKFYVNSNTEIYDSANTLTGFSSLKAGLMVKIKASLQSDSTFLARRIRIVGNHEFNISGYITAINGDTLWVSGLTILVDSNTHVFNEADSLINFSDLAVNQEVEVRAVMQPDGSYLALIISIDDDPEITEISGNITAMASNLVSISASGYVITSSTVVLNSRYQPVSGSSIAVGQQVTIWSSASQSGESTALQIQLATSSVTNVKDNGSTLPKEYNLSQNYPNPFNPTTNIRYSIPQQGLVTLKIYDILGREVATLVNSVKAPGTYQVTFNGSNLASGVYIYRLQAGNYVSVKKLVLMK